MSTQNTIISTLRNYEVLSDRKSLGIYLFTVIGLLVSVAASIWVSTINVWFSAIFALPSGIFLCRMFVVQHDLGHGSFFTKRVYNKYGGLLIGFFTMIPSRLWEHIHNTHHGLVGNLNERKANPELWTMTVEEYKNAPTMKRILYRIMRSYTMRLLITPALWIIAPRIPIPSLGLKILLSVIAHNIIYAVGLYFVFKHDLFLELTLIYLIPLYIFNFIASVFFYLQHQYEDTVWKRDEEWDLYTASIHGSSHLVTGKFLAWVSGNVGCHHVHHLNTKIPNYMLYNATEDANQHLDIKPIYLKDLFFHMNHVLWDEDADKLVSFKSLRQA